MTVDARFTARKPITGYPASSTGLARFLVEVAVNVTVIDATVRLGSVTIFVPDGIEVRMTGRAVLGAKSSDLRRAPRPGAPVIEVRCDVLLGSVTVRRPKFMMGLRSRLELT